MLFLAHFFHLFYSISILKWHKPKEYRNENVFPLLLKHYSWIKWRKIVFEFFRRRKKLKRKNVNILSTSSANHTNCCDYDYYYEHKHDEKCNMHSAAPLSKLQHLQLEVVFGLIKNNMKFKYVPTPVTTTAAFEMETLSANSVWHVTTIPREEKNPFFRHAMFSFFHFLIWKAEKSAFELL